MVSVACDSADLDPLVSHAPVAQAGKSTRVESEAWRGRRQPTGRYLYG